VVCGVNILGQRTIAHSLALHAIVCPLLQPID
jgi:hypothetical protein